eukprot:6785856-Heterocapsa_arctica.AAC.1
MKDTKPGHSKGTTPSVEGPGTSDNSTAQGTGKQGQETPWHHPRRGKGRPGSKEEEIELKNHKSIA